MKKQLRLFLALVLLLSLTAFNSSDANAKEIHITFIHTNDIYEILPVSGGKVGGLARLTTLKKELKKDNPNTFITLSGDYHGPSGMGLAPVSGKILAGEQTVSALNKVGIDFSTFGDHEFNVYPIKEHLKRIAETTFPIISSNVFTGSGVPFKGIKSNKIITITNAEGEKVRLGIFGVTEVISRVSDPSKITRTDSQKAALEQVNELKDKTDIIIALTHQSITDDKALAQAAPEIDIILGGDEHELTKEVIGSGFPTIYKSDSNVRNLQVIDIYYNTETKVLRIEDRVEAITDSLKNDPIVQVEIDKWKNIAFDAYKNTGINPSEVIAIPTVALDGLASSVRNKPTELTKVLLKGIHSLTSNPELALYVGGLIRLDDVIPVGGEFTRYDILRTFPLNTQLMTLDIPGLALKTILTNGETAKGTGYYILKTENVTQASDNSWLIDGKALDTQKTYRVGGDFAVEANFKSLGVIVVEKHKIFASDALAKQLAKDYPK